MVAIINVNYNIRYVAFLDLMGFKNLVFDSVGNHYVLDNINRALDYICYLQNDNYHGKIPMVDLGRQVTVFSDSIVISYDTAMPGGGFHVLMDLVYICNDLLGIGIPVRGGVTVGELIHDERKCFGPAMIEAYMLESDVAKFPRIIIEPKVLQYDLFNPGQANTIEYEEKYLIGLVKRDLYDGKIFLDYLKQYNEFDEIEVYNDYIFRTRKFIIENLNRYKSEAGIYEKYDWLKGYYNETVMNLYPAQKELIIK